MLGTEEEYASRDSTGLVQNPSMRQQLCGIHRVETRQAWWEQHVRGPVL